MNNYETFCYELKRLSLKHGIVIQSVGGVMVCNPASIDDINYDSDLESGDLIPEIKWKD